MSATSSEKPSGKDMYSQITPVESSEEFLEKCREYLIEESREDILEAFEGSYMSLYSSWLVTSNY